MHTLHMTAFQIDIRLIHLIVQANLPRYDERVETDGTLRSAVIQFIH